MWRILPALTLILSACAGAPPVSRTAPPQARSGLTTPDRPLRSEEVQGLATWYGKVHHGRQTASGEPFDMYALTAAHKTLPFNTIVRVLDTQTHKSVVVRINDRGPYAPGRIIDLSYAAAGDLGIVKKGKVTVDLEILEWGDGQRVHAKYKARYGR
jgi:rare lipoprotein A